MINNKNHLFFLYGLFLLLALIWSASFIAIKIGIEFFSPIFAAMLRVAVAFICLTIINFCLKTPLRLPIRIARLLWLQGIIAQGIAFLFLFWGEQYIAPALASIINSTVPLWVLLINGVILRQKKTFTFKKILGLMLGFIGIVYLFAPMLLNHTETDQNSKHLILGALSITGMAISYAVGAVLYQRLLGKTSINFQSSIWHQYVGSLTFLFLVSILSDSWPTTKQLSSFSYEALSAIIYLGVFSTAVAWMIYSHLIVQWGAIRALSVLYIVPIFSIIWDNLFLHMTMSLHQVLGVAIIFSGLLFVQKASRD